jgi:hypothetical protein
VTAALSVTDPSGNSFSTVNTAVAIDPDFGEHATLTIGNTSENVGSATATFTISGLDAADTGSGNTGTVSFVDGTQTVTMGVMGDGTYTANLSTLTAGTVTTSLSFTDAAGNTFSASGNNVTIVGQAPTLTGPGGSQSMTFHHIAPQTEFIVGVVSDSSTGAITLTATDTNKSGVNFNTITVTESSPGQPITFTLSVTAGVAGAQDTILISAWESTGGTAVATAIDSTQPAGVAGSPINLALTDPAAGESVTVTVAGMRAGWSLNGGTNLGNGTWTVQTTDPSSLAVTTPATFAGAAVLNVSESWTNADGSTGSAFVADNVEAYAPGSPIFAVSGNDTLTGAGANDEFVFAQPIGNDAIYNFNAASDKIDLIGFANIAAFSNIQANLANDAKGNAVITLGPAETITLVGVSAASLTAANFVFNQTPVVQNTGTIAVSDGATLPLDGTINNVGSIVLNSTGDLTVLLITGAGITLQGGGTLTLSNNSENSIVGTTSTTTLTNVDNTISGAGQIGSGDGTLTLVNEAKGAIDANVAGTLTLDTGQNIVNAGLLEASNGGTLLIMDIVSGGVATIAGGKLVFDAQSNVNVTFNNGTGTPTYGELVLADAPAFTGQIYGFTGTVPNPTNSDAIDLTDIKFANLTTETYAENSAGTGGTLTVSDGTNTASLQFMGNYQLANFIFQNDGSGGTLIVDPPVTDTSTSTDSSSTNTMTTNGSSTTTTTSADSSPTNTTRTDDLSTATTPTDGSSTNLSNIANEPLGAAFNPASNFDLGADGLLKLDHSSLFSGTVAGLAGGNALDLGDIAFGSNDTIGYTPNTTNTGGTLTVSDGTHAANIALLGQYAAAGFATGADSHGGTILTYVPPQTSTTEQPLLTKPSH